MSLGLREGLAGPDGPSLNYIDSRIVTDEIICSWCSRLNAGLLYIMDKWRMVFCAMEEHNLTHRSVHLQIVLSLIFISELLGCCMFLSDDVLLMIVEKICFHSEWTEFMLHITTFLFFHFRQFFQSVSGNTEYKTYEVIIRSIFVESKVTSTETISDSTVDLFVPVFTVLIVDLLFLLLYPFYVKCFQCETSVVKQKRL